MVPAASRRLSGLSNVEVTPPEKTQLPRPAEMGCAALSCSAKPVGTLALPAWAPVPFQTRMTPLPLVPVWQGLSSAVTT
jgi:hypothetical protein